MENANKNIYVIYKHTNKINGKIYVGQTGLEPQERWRYNGRGYEHYWVDENGVKHPSHFWSAIRKYKWNNFEHKVLIHGLTKSQADFWEKKLIKAWDLMNPEKGYNKKEGGSYGKYSDESRKKISEANKGKIISEESKQKMSKTKKEKYANGEIKSWNKGKKCPQLSGENNGFYGRKHTDKSKQQMSEKAKKRFKNPENNPFYAKHHTEKTRQIISEKLKESKAFAGVNNPRATKVVRLSDNKIYDLIQNCAKDNNLSTETITRHCKNKLKTKPQEFMYYDEFLDIKDKMC